MPRSTLFEHARVHTCPALTHESEFARSMSLSFFTPSVSPSLHPHEPSRFSTASASSVRSILQALHATASPAHATRRSMRWSWSLSWASPAHAICMCTDARAVASSLHVGRRQPASCTRQLLARSTPSTVNILFRVRPVVGIAARSCAQVYSRARSTRRCRRPAERRPRRLQA